MSRVQSLSAGVIDFGRKRVLIVVTLLSCLAVVGAAAALAIGLIFGSAGRDSERFPFPIVDKFANQIRANLSSHYLLTPAAPGEEKIQTAYVPLRMRTVDLPPAPRDGTGGGLTVAREHVVILTFAGEIFALTPDRDLITPSITPPDHGLEDLRKISKIEPYSTHPIDFYNFRYSDIAYFEHDGRAGFLIAATHFHGEKECYTSILSRAFIAEPTFDPARTTIAASDWEPIFETSPCLPLKSYARGFFSMEAGGRMVFDPEDAGRVYLTVGDYGWVGFGPMIFDPDNPIGLAQDPNSHYGKVYAIEYLSGSAEQIAMGFRNPQGITIDDQGRMWTVEHGPRGGDELNLVEPGANFGWPLATYGTQASGLALPSVNAIGLHERYTQPKLAWLPSIGPSGLMTIRNFHSSWDGDLLATTLTSHMIVRIHIEDERVVYTEEIKLGRGRRARYALQDPTGALVIYTDGRQLLLIEPVEGGLAAELIEHYIANNLGGSASYKESVRAAIDACMQCHSLEAGEHRAGPSLAATFGAEVGSTSFEAYSDAIKASNDVWDRDRLNAYLASPNEVYSGTTMPDPQLSDPEVRSAVVDILEVLKDRAHQ